MSMTNRRTTRVGDVLANRIPQVISDPRGGRVLEVYHPLSEVHLSTPPFCDMYDDDFDSLLDEVYRWSELNVHDREERLAAELSINAIIREIGLRIELDYDDFGPGLLPSWAAMRPWSMDTGRYRGSMFERPFGGEPLYHSDYNSASDCSIDLPQRGRRAGNASQSHTRYSWRTEGHTRSRSRADSLSRNDSVATSFRPPRGYSHRTAQATATQESALAARGRNPMRPQRTPEPPTAQQAGGHPGQSRRYQQRHPRASLAAQAANQAESNEQQPGPSS